jgi:hypothetical protein
MAFCHVYGKRLGVCIISKPWDKAFVDDVPTRPHIKALLRNTMSKPNC